MSRMSGPKRKRFYDILARRDGEYCFIGGEPGTRETLEIDHADGDRSHNCLPNLHLVCPSINSMKNPRGRGKKKLSSVCVSVCEDELEPAPPASAEFRKNLQSEPAFRHFLFIEVWRRGMVPIDELIDCGAAAARCSQETVKRYLRKECSHVRLYEVVDDPESKQRSVRFRPEWERHRQKELKRRELDWQARNWRKDQIKDISFIQKHAKAKIDERALHSIAPEDKPEQRHP
jgi:hypothetical protein